MLFLSWNKSKERKGKKKTKTRNQNKAKIKTRRKKERKKATRERQTKRNWKSGRPRMAKKKQRWTLKNKQKMPFLWAKQIFQWEARKGKKTNRKKNKNTKIPKKGSFQLSINISFLVGVQRCPKFPFLTTWPKKRAPKNTIKIGVSAKHVLKSRCVTKRPALDKKTQTRNSSYHIFAYSFLFQQEKHKNWLKPLFL